MSNTDKSPSRESPRHGRPDVSDDRADAEFVEFEGGHPAVMACPLNIEVAGDDPLEWEFSLVTGPLLAIAVAMALSSVPIMATVIILLSPQRRRSSLPFLAGWMLTIAVVALGAAGGALALPLSGRERRQVATATEIVVGVALVVGATLTWRRSRIRASKPKSRLEALGSQGPAASFGIAFLMGVRPKALLLGVAAGLVLGAQPLTSTGSALTLALYVVVSASTVAVLIVSTLVSPHSMEPRLVTWHDWLSRNGLNVTAWVMLIVGLALLAAGLSGV